MRKNLLIILVIAANLYAGLPMEAAKRTLTVYQHGISPDKDGLNANGCYGNSGSAHKFRSHKNFGYMAGEILNSYHHLYTQSLSHPGWSPVHLAEEFGSRGYSYLDATEYNNFTTQNKNEQIAIYDSLYWYHTERSSDFWINQNFPNYFQLQKDSISKYHNSKATRYFSLKEHYINLKIECPEVFWPLVLPSAKKDQKFTATKDYALKNYGVLENSALRWMAGEMHAYMIYEDERGLQYNEIFVKDSIRDTIIRGVEPNDIKGIQLDGNFSFIELINGVKYDSIAQLGTIDYTISDPRLYNWFKAEGLEIFEILRGPNVNDTNVYFTSDQVSFWLAKLRDERPDLVPSRYNILVHSMGGLTSREYVQGDDYLNDVNKIIFFDSPHQGSGIADASLTAMEKADFWNDNPYEDMDSMDFLRLLLVEGCL